LARALGIPKSKLLRIAENIPSLYIGPKPQPKKKGNGVRYVWDTAFPLKPLLKKINTTFLKRVWYPQFLTGSLAGIDFVSNVKIHTQAAILDSEDIEAFFDRITKEHIFDIWRRFFRFSEEVAELLTTLTTNNGVVYQGAPTSSYLANLVFWENEARIAKTLQEKGFRYSRYVDDITVSSRSHKSPEEISWAISQIYGLMSSRRLRPKRSKHQIQTGASNISLMGLNANRKPAISSREKSQIRTAVFQLEKLAEKRSFDIDFDSCLRSAIGRVMRLRRLHAAEGERLYSRLQTVRSIASAAKT